MLAPYDTIDLTTSFGESAVRLALAALCGALIGWDRESVNRDAGLRTHMLVALGAAGFTLIAIELFESLRALGETASGDVVRILAAIVGGVGFLGAGAIMRGDGEVRGLTTAAGLWVIAAVGVAAGAGLETHAILITLLAFLTLTVARVFKKVVPDRTNGDVIGPGQTSPDDADDRTARGS